MADTIVARERAIPEAPDKGAAAPASRGSQRDAGDLSPDSGPLSLHPRTALREGAIDQHVGAAADTELTRAVQTKVAAQGLEEIASLAASTDRSCYYHHDTFMVAEDEHLSPEQINLELDRLRDVIRRLGWMADACYTRLTGAVGVRSAEEWFFSPKFNKMAEGAGNGRAS